MARLIGTVSRGVRAPIIRKGDDIVDVVSDAVLSAAASENIPFLDKDVIALTESIVARAQDNYASVDAIAQDVKSKYPNGEVGLVFPILSRNRFAINLKGIARAMDKIYLQLSLPSDEVGNQLISYDAFEESGLSIWNSALTEEQYRAHFGQSLHPYTGVDYISYYREIAEAEDCEIEIILSNNPRVILDYTKDVLTCDIHSRKKNLRRIEEAGANILFNIESILTEPIGDNGYNPEFGMLGANKATEESVKLFPRGSQAVVDALSKKLSEATGKQIEVMIYGDGAFRDPTSQIWELADPIVSPAHTPGLSGVPQEIKLKYVADNTFADLTGEELDEAVKNFIQEKDQDTSEVDQESAVGTTPRKITDLLGSLADLTSGSGDKGTPIVWIQGYFDDLADA